MFQPEGEVLPQPERYPGGHQVLLQSYHHMPLGRKNNYLE